MSCCSSLFVNLGGTVNTGFLQIAGGVPLDSTLRFVEDQSGTDSVLKLSTTQIEIASTTTKSVILSGSSAPYISWGSDVQFIQGFLSSGTAGIQIGVNSGAKNLNITDSNGLYYGGGTITPNGALTVKGAGSNIASFRNSSNVEVIRVNSVGTIESTSGNMAINVSGQFFGSQFRSVAGFGINDWVSDGIHKISNNAQNGFTRLILGANSIDHPAIAATNTPATLAAKNATGANLIPFSAEDFTSGNLSTGTLITARPMQFGDKATVTTGNDLGLDAQIAVEHNGNVYYIPCSTVLLT
jgi:hypothetical protein